MTNKKREVLNLLEEELKLAKKYSKKDVYGLERAITIITVNIN